MYHYAAPACNVHMYGACKVLSVTLKKVSTAYKYDHVFPEMYYVFVQRYHKMIVYIYCMHYNGFVVY